MAVTDALIGTVRGAIKINMARTEDNMSGDDRVDQDYVQSFIDGTTANCASGWCSERVTATVAAVTFSLADSADPFGSIGDSVPSSDPEGLKLRAIMIRNEDATNYVTIKKGTNGLTSWFSGSTDTLRIPAGGMLVATFPSGLDTMNDGVDDEIVIQANTDSVICNISYLFG